MGRQRDVRRSRRCRFLPRSGRPGEEELAELRFAKGLLENPGFTARMTSLLGGPIEKGMKMLPPDWNTSLNKSVRRALFKSLEVAVASLGAKQPQRDSDWLHKVMVGASGAIGGAFGLASVAVELPISTTFMLRSIADIARSEGHDLESASVKLACLEVFALGGTSKSDDASESGYWAIRTALAKAISEAAAFVAQRGTLQQSAPAVVRLITAIAGRFGVIVSEQIAAKAVPSPVNIIRPAARSACGRTSAHRHSRASRASCRRRSASGGPCRSCRCSDRGSRRHPTDPCRRHPA